MDQLSGKNWGGENVSVVIMQLGAIPKIGGVAAGSTLAPAVWGAGAWAVAAVLLCLLVQGGGEEPEGAARGLRRRIVKDFSWTDTFEPQAQNRSQSSSAWHR
eukprot:1653280-Rhodomonas_salina.2